MRRIIALILIGTLTATMAAYTGAKTIDTTIIENVVVNETDEDGTSETEWNLEDDMLIGGWHTYQDTEIDQYALDALNKALEGLEGVAYEPIRLLATQVVAGTNYAFLCKSTVIYPNAKPGYCIVYVYEDLEGNAELVRIQDLELADDEEIAGGWNTEVTEEIKEAANEALEKTLEGMVGATYETVAVLASQTVAGTNYMLLCKVTPVYPDAEGTYSIITVYEDLDGEVEITDFDEMEYSLEEEIEEEND